jgi:hypothetical protein
MTTVIEVVAPLDVAAATRLDKRIRLMAATVRENLIKIADLVEEAKAGQVHVALGFASWTAYLADALGGQLELGTDDRRAVVELLAGEGMSNRAIATAVGVTEGTVRNDKVRSDCAPEPVTGLDGKTYAKKPKKKPVPQPAPQPATVVDSTTVEHRPTGDEILAQSDELDRRAVEIVKDLFNDLVTTAEQIEEDPDDGDTHELWSPDVTITVTSRIDYEDLRPWTLSVYRAAGQLDAPISQLAKFAVLCSGAFEVPPDSTLRRRNTGEQHSDQPASLDVFGATLLRLDHLILIANMARWIEAEFDENSITANSELLSAYELWDRETMDALRTHLREKAVAAAAGGDLGE